ncbi:DUF805 domain-containing protein [Massilia sp. CCM 9210]|uniref:DUF805 domain-containing protein n=1 Tax=Massilia scottii TaxID=3057166 RepID=UPI002796B5E1|nr:DUF805 domain-containing protein [Massilia sp. CCM 9210]MDQ1816412.1 DUF805 domain-containing protein [Massilia sp. CCM 9210]
MNNPYAAPATNMLAAMPVEPTYVPRMLATTGRIGRVRYLVYLSLSTGVLMAATALMVEGLMKIGPLASMLALVMAIPLLAVILVTTGRRMNDMGHSGWWGLLHLVPLVNVLFWVRPVLGPGDGGANQYGLPPVPNTWLLVIAAWVFPVAVFLTLPTYLKFQQRWISSVVTAYYHIPLPGTQGDAADATGGKR